MVRSEPIPEGCRVFHGDELVAVVTTSEHMSDDEVRQAIQANQVDALFARAHGAGNGPVAWKKMRPADWSIHLTRPSISVDLFRAIAAGIPTD